MKTLDELIQELMAIKAKEGGDLLVIIDGGPAIADYIIGVGVVAVAHTEEGPIKNEKKLLDEEMCEKTVEIII